MFKQLGTFAILAVCLFALVCASVCPPVAASISESGKIVYTTNALGDWDIAVMGPNGGHVEGLTSSTDDEYNPTWSPDGTEILYIRNRFGTSDIYLMDADGSNQRPITTIAYDPSWAPDGDRFVARWSSGALVIYELNEARDGWDDFDIIVSSDTPVHPAWSPDGRYIAYVDGPDFVTGASLYVYDVAADRSTKIVSGFPGSNMSWPTWGPQSDNILFAWAHPEYAEGNPGIFGVGRTGVNLGIALANPGYYLYHPTVAPYGGEVVFTMVNPDTGERDLKKITSRTSNVQDIGLSEGTFNDDADWWHPSSFSVEPGASQLTTTWGSLKKKAK